MASEIDLAGERLVCDASGALYAPALHLLVVSDLHLEKGSAAARRGRLIPPYDTLATLVALQKVIDRYQPATVISLGDSFHDEGASARLPAVYREQLLTLMRGRDWCWIRGNHDPRAPDNLPGDDAAELAVSSLVFRHEPGTGDSVGEVAGHLHPCARVVQRGRSITRRCFAHDGRRLIMPAFGAYTGSLNVLDLAYRGLFDAASLMAHMLGESGIFAIPGSRLRSG